MASRDTLFILTPANGTPPTGTTTATIDLISDASTPPAQTPVLDFDTTTAEWMHWHITIWELPIVNKASTT